MLVGTVENKRVTEEKLISFGFKKKDGKFTYRKEIADGQMSVEIILDGGKIIAQGNHSELMKNSNVYREIYETQTRSKQAETSEIQEGGDA